MIIRDAHEVEDFKGSFYVEAVSAAGVNVVTDSKVGDSFEQGQKLVFSSAEIVPWKGSDYIMVEVKQGTDTISLYGSNSNNAVMLMRWDEESKTPYKVTPAIIDHTDNRVIPLYYSSYAELIEMFGEVSGITSKESGFVLLKKANTVIDSFTKDIMKSIVLSINEFVQPSTMINSVKDIEITLYRPFSDDKGKADITSKKIAAVMKPVIGGDPEYLDALKKHVGEQGLSGSITLMDENTILNPGESAFVRLDTAALARYAFYVEEETKRIFIVDAGADDKWFPIAFLGLFDNTTLSTGVVIDGLLLVADTLHPISVLLTNKGKVPAKPLVDVNSALTISIMKPASVD